MNVNIHKVSGFYNVFEVILEDSNRIRVSLLTYGAAICRLMLPNRNDSLENVVLGYENYCNYRENPLYAGATLAPNAGRIAGSSLPVKDQVFALSANDGRHNLHGGFQNASCQNWTIASYTETSENCSVTFTLQLPHGLDGFPGNRKLSVCYTLTSRQSLEITYQGNTDRLTYFNTSNHSYFNLSGDFTRSGLEQTLQVNADTYIANNEEHIPTGPLPCAGSPFDFRTPATLISRIKTDPDNVQLHNARGYNNAFLLNTSHTGIKKALSLKDNASGRQLTLYTDAPSIVLYSGGYIGDSHVLAGNVRSSNSCALALEAQDIPDAPHIVPNQYRLTDSGETFRRTIIYAFGQCMDDTTDSASNF